MWIFPGPPDIHLMPLHVMILLSLHSLLYLLVTKQWTEKALTSRVVHPRQNTYCNSSNNPRVLQFSQSYPCSQAHSKCQTPWERCYFKVFLFSPFAGRTEERTLRDHYYRMYDTPTWWSDSQCALSVTAQILWCTKSPGTYAENKKIQPTSCLSAR